MDQTPQIDQEENEEIIFSTVDFDLLMNIFESESINQSLIPIDTPVKECGPQQPQTDCHMPLGAASLSLQQPVMPAPEFHAAQTGLPHPSPHDAPANGGFGPQQPQTDCHMPLGASSLSLQQPVMPAQTGLPHPSPHDAPANGGFGPQQPQTDCHMPLGASSLSLQQPVLPAPEFRAAQTGWPHPPPHDAPANGGFGPQQPQTDSHMPLGAAPLSLQQPVLPAPGYHAEQTGLPHPPPHDAPANGEFGPQQPQTDCHMPLGASSLSLQQPVMPAQTGLPHPSTHDAPANGGFGPQQPQTDCQMPLGAAPLSLQQPVMPAPGFHAAQTGLPHFHPHDASAKGGFGPQQPQTDCHMPLGAAPLNLQQGVMPTPGFHAAQTGVPFLPPYNAPAQGNVGPQQPQTDCHMPLGAAPLNLQQGVMPTPGFHAAQTGVPFLPPYNAPAQGNVGPQQPQTDCHMPLGAAPLNLQQGVMPTPGFHAAQTGVPFLPPYNAPAQENVGPQQPQTDCHMPLGAAPLNLQQGVMPTPGFHAAQTGVPFLPPYNAPAQGNVGPQQPQTDCHMPLGAAPLNLQQGVMPTPGFHAAQTGVPFLPPYNAPAQENVGPQQPQTDCHMPLGAAPLNLQQGVMPTPGFHAAQTGVPFLPPYNAPAQENVGPQQPQTDCHMPLGAAPLNLQQPVMPAPGFHAAQTGLPHFPPHNVPANGGFGPQQPQNCHMPLGGVPFRQQQPVMPAPGLAPPMYHPATILPNYMFPQAAPFGHCQVNNRPGLGMNMAPVGFMNGGMVFRAPAYIAPPVATDVPEVKGNTSKMKRCHRKPEDESKPYIKKPPNAFMIYRKEMRPKVVAELQTSECATVNKFIGQKWKSMSKEEQAKYYELADVEKQLHKLLYPEWTTSDNYGKKRKRIRGEQGQVIDQPVVSHPQDLGVSMAPVGFMNGGMVYGAPAYTAPPVATDVPEVRANTLKRCHSKSHDESKPYIKKPPNAFMLFRKEMRPEVVAELQTSDCATVNKVIGERWKSMSKEEQEIYYERADVEKQLHNQLFPEWSSSDNYGKQMKRIRTKSLS